MMHALSIALFNKPIPIAEFPHNLGLIGKGMSDWEGYAHPLSCRLGYTNTYYHKEPRLDITNVIPEDYSSLDFLISTDVFEHVAPPVSIAFENASKLLKPGGVFVFSVPYSLDDDTVEHFPDLNDFKIIDKNGGRVLINKTINGQIQEFSDLVFHGGEGETIEMRVFAEAGLLKELEASGFTQVEIVKDPYFEFGIFWPKLWSLPIIARKAGVGITVEDWGPRSLAKGFNVNCQPDGRSALWIKISNGLVSAGLELHFDGIIVDQIVRDGTVITAIIPSEVLSHEGARSINLYDRISGSSLYIGSLLITT